MFATVDKEALLTELVRMTGQVITTSQLEAAIRGGENLFPKSVEESIRTAPEKVVALDFRNIKGVAQNTTAAVCKINGETVIVVTIRQQSRFESVETYNLSTLLKHEFVHYHQVLDGRLEVEGLSWDGTVVWEGKKYKVRPFNEIFNNTSVADATLGLIKYMSQPWELEAQRGCWGVNNLEEMEDVVSEIGTCWNDEWDEELFKKELEEGGIELAYRRYGYSGRKENIADFKFSERCIGFFVQNPAHLLKLTMPSQALVENDGVWDLKEYDPYLPDIEILNRLNGVVIDKTMTIDEMVKELHVELHRINTEESKQLIDALTISGFAA